MLFFPSQLLHFVSGTAPCTDLRSTSDLVFSENSVFSFFPHARRASFLHFFNPVTHVPKAQIRVSAAFIASLRFYSNCNSIYLLCFLCFVWFLIVVLKILSYQFIWNISAAEVILIFWYSRNSIPVFELSLYAIKSLKINRILLTDIRISDYEILSSLGSPSVSWVMLVLPRSYLLSLLCIVFCHLVLFKVAFFSSKKPSKSSNTQTLLPIHKLFAHLWFCLPCMFQLSLESQYYQQGKNLLHRDFLLFKKKKIHTNWQLVLWRSC